VNSRIHCEVNFGAVDSMTLDVFAMSLLVIKEVEPHIPVHRNGALLCRRYSHHFLDRILASNL
jgi:hypothetical protein